MSFFEGLGGKKPCRSYQLSDFQFGVLHSAANGGSVAFAVLESIPSDPPQQQEVYENELRQIKELVEVGLLENISDQFLEGIKMSKLNNNNRGYMVAKMTDVSLLMFRKSAIRKPN